MQRQCWLKHLLYNKSECHENIIAISPQAIMGPIPTSDRTREKEENSSRKAGPCKAGPLPLGRPVEESQ
jgi:hypothetical protein